MASAPMGLDAGTNVLMLQKVLLLAAKEAANVP